MKFLKIAAVVLFSTAIFASCKKDNDNVQSPGPSSGIEGKWMGNYGHDGEMPSIVYRFNIKNGGIIEELNASDLVKGSGTWSLNGNTFYAHYQWKAPLLTIFTVTGTYNSSSKKLSGTWGYDDDATNGGMWEMTKQSN